MAKRNILLLCIGAAVLFIASAWIARAYLADSDVEPEIIYITATRQPTYIPTIGATTVAPSATTPPVIPTRTPQTIPSATHTIVAFPTATPSVISSPVSPVPVFTATPQISARIAISSEVGAWLRGGPGVDYEIVGEVLPGSIYPALAYQNRDDTTWYLIMLENGQTAWVSELVASPAEGTTLDEIALAATIPPAALPTATITATATMSPPLGADAYVSYERDKLRLRSAPDENARVLTLLPELTSLTLLGRTPDDEWYQVITEGGREGWVMAKFITLNIAQENVPVVQFVPTAPPVLAAGGNDCVSVVGDSMPYGDIVYMIPERGFMTVRATPFSTFLTQQLQAAGSNLTVIDRTAPAVMLAPDGQNPYQQTPAYSALLNDRCRFTVVMPWLNDLNLTRPENASVHVDDLVRFFQALQQANPDGKILMFGYYYGQPADFVGVYATGYTAENVEAFNQRLFEACAPGGKIAQFSHVTCVPVEDMLWSSGSNVFAGSIKREAMQASLVEPVPLDAQPLLDNFWQSNPEGMIIGDGIHLSGQGKNVLAQFVVQQLLALTP